MYTTCLKNSLINQSLSKVGADVLDQKDQEEKDHRCDILV